MDQSLTVREHQEAQDKLEMDETQDEFEMDDEYDTSNIYRMCQKQLMEAAVELIEVWLDN
jgi:hypothetical protein